MPAPIGAGDVFSRRLISDGVQIESTCKFCGVVIIGSASESLPGDEQQHIKDCPNIPRA
jgi:hypothetical protein